MGSRDYGNSGRPYPNSNSTPRRSFDLESNIINSNNNSNNNIGMSMSNASSMREKYSRDPEIDKIAEGNEDEGEENGDEFQSEMASSTMSYATMAPFYQPKAKKATDFSNKEDVLFSYENVMHSSKKSPPDSLSIRSSNINSNVNTSGNSNSQKEDIVYQEKVFQDNPMGR